MFVTKWRVGRLRPWAHFCKPRFTKQLIFVTKIRFINKIRRFPNMTHSDENPLVGVIMGSQSDWSTMRKAHDILHDLGIAHECKIISAHRTPDRMYEYAKSAKNRGLKVIIAGAGGAAHLPGMVASLTPLPVLGVPVESKALSGMDSLLSIAQMPGGIPVGTLAIGEAGAKNAAILAGSIIGAFDNDVQAKLEALRAKHTDAVAEEPN